MTPDLELLHTLPPTIDKDVRPDHIDENGHMNIGHYFRYGATAAWHRLRELMGEDYLSERGLSFFTVEHNLRYLAEMREGQRFTVRPGLVGRTSKALHAVSFVVDESTGRLACVMEIMLVHIAFADRRSVAIPGDLAESLDREIASYPWLGEVATGLSLRR